MREILFRGKRTNDGKWVYGHLIESDTYTHQIFIVTEANWESSDKSFDFLDTDVYEVLPETVGQYTGLTDKNGNKIFEGDILKASYFDWKYVVEWDEDNGRFLGFTIESERKIAYVRRKPKSEIIGNIHDNPELLEVES